jgi:signal transduction histidine kinase
VKTSSKRVRRSPARARPKTHAEVSVRAWPSDAEQTLEALRGGLIDALVIPAGQHDSVYALKTFEELEEANRQLRESQERLLMLLSERERLMQDLHDGCIQSIYGVGLALEDCRGLIGEDPRRAAQKVAQAAASLNLVIQELRAFISGVRPVTVVDLPREIKRIVKSVGSRAPRFKIEIEEAATKALSPDMAEQLLKIAHEALSNVVRHAQAKSARISLRRTGAKVRLEVTDNGKGFDANADKGRGLGLHHIAARVEKLGGHLRLDARPAHGCRIVVEIAA